MGEALLPEGEVFPGAVKPFGAVAAEIVPPRLLDHRPDAPEVVLHDLEDQDLFPDGLGDAAVPVIIVEEELFVFRGEVVFEEEGRQVKGGVVLPRILPVDEVKPALAVFDEVGGNQVVVAAPQGGVSPCRKPAP